MPPGAAASPPAATPGPRRAPARRDASVRAYREESGNAGISGRELPAGEVLASFQNIEQRALDLRALGVEGSLRELKVLAMLDLLQERDSTLRLTAQDQGATPDQAAQDQAAAVTDPAGSDSGNRPHDAPDDGEPDDDEDGGSGPAPGGGPGRGGPHGPAGTGGSGGSGGTR